MHRSASAVGERLDEQPRGRWIAGEVYSGRGIRYSFDNPRSLYIRETPSQEFFLRVSSLDIHNEKTYGILSAAPTPPRPSAPLGLEFQSNEEIKLGEHSKRGVWA